jgi:ABC-2 type transport system permease protein
MTRFFPAGLAALMVVGMAIAYYVLNNNDTAVDFVNDIAGGVEARDILGLVATLLPVMAFVIGASYIGADAKTGMLEQILTWEPRRLRFLGARTVISIVSVGLLAMALAVFLVALLYGLAAAVGTTGGTTGELWGNVALSVLRTGLAAGLFCAFGLGVTLLVNNSVGSIVGFVIYWFIIESFLVSVFLPKVAVYLPVTNASAFAQGAAVQQLQGSVFNGSEPNFTDHHSYLVAGAILAGWTILALAGSAVAFKQRDIA